MAIHSAVPFEHGEGDDDYLPQSNESYVTTHRHLQEYSKNHTDFQLSACDDQSTAVL